MAINPELITTIRVDQLPDETLSLTNLFPHTVGTDLKSATIQELVDLVATAIGVSGGVGYIALSVTDGQQLPDVPELPSFFLCGAGTFLNINGYPNIICTENLNAIMSLTDHWELAVEIPINPLSGTVQSVTGSAVDNTDPLNPVINSTGSAGTLAETLVLGNLTDGTDISISDGDKILLDNGANLKKGTTDAGLGGSKGIALRCAVDYELKWEAGRLYVMGGDGFTIREVSHNFTTTPTVTDDDDKGFVIDSRWILDNGNVYICTDATTGAAVWELVNTGTTPTLQEVLDNNHDLVDGNNFQGKYAGLDNTGINVIGIGDGVAQANSGSNVVSIGSDANCAENTGSHLVALGIDTASSNSGSYVVAIGFGALSDNTADEAVAIGRECAQSNTGESLIVMGSGTGQNNSGDNVNAFGNGAVGSNEGNNVNAIGNSAGISNTFNNVNLFGQNASADENGQTVLSKNGTIMARISTTDLTATRKYNLPDSSGTIALTSDIPSSSGIPHATATGTDTYTATVTGVIAYADGDAYLIRFTNGNTSGATLNINSLGAITLYRNNDGVLIGGDIISGGEMLCIYNSTTNGFQCIGTAPNSLFSYVTNADSVTLTKGMPVYAFGGTGDRMTVKRANNSADATSAQTVGLVLSTSIAANQKGLIMMQGLLDGLSILPTSTWADGDAVYLGATAGTITNVKPYAPNHLVYLGVVTTANNGSAGRMYVRVQNGYELDELHNVQAQSPTLKDTLWYDNTVSPAQWKTASISTVLGFTPENVANKENTTLDTSTTKYPTNRLTKEYADAKVTDAITDGVTTVAPSQNAVFDALALKQNSLGYTPYRNVQTSQTAVTSTVAETIVFTATIPAGAFSSNDILKILFGVNKLNSLAGYTLRIRLNTTNTISGSTIIALYTGSTTPQLNIIMRNFNLNGGNLYGYLFSTSALTDIAATAGALSSTTLNPANQFYIFATVQLTGLTDSIIGNMFTIHN